MVIRDRFWLTLWFLVMSAHGLLASEALVLVVAGPMTGPSAAVGLQMRRGAALAVMDVNAHGGVLGRPVRMEVQDDACDPRQALTIATFLMRRQIKLVVGHACSGASLLASEVYGENDVLMVSPASTTPALTDNAAAAGWRTIFRLAARDDELGRFVGAWVALRHRGARVAVINDQTVYGFAQAEQVRAALQVQGIPSVLDGTMTPGEEVPPALLADIKRINPSILYFAGYAVEAGHLVRQMRARGVAAVLMTNGSLVTPDFWAIAGPDVAGTLMAFAPEPRDNPAARQVVQRLLASGFNPEGYTLYTYAAVQVIMAGAAVAGSVEPNQIAAVLRSGRPIDTVLGPIAFDNKGDLKNARYAMYIWDGDGQYREQP